MRMEVGGDKKTDWWTGDFIVFVRLKPFRSIQTIAGLWDVGQGVTLVLGEMDVAQVNPYRSDQEYL